jgi:hypothetical protein
LSIETAETPDRGDASAERRKPMKLKSAVSCRKTLRLICRGFVLSKIENPLERENPARELSAMKRHPITSTKLVTTLPL